MQRRVIRKLRSEFPTEWRGDYSGQAKPSAEVAKNQSDFKKMWAKAHGRRYPVPPAPVLPRGKMAIGIFAGETESPADISVTSCTEDKRRLTVTWQATAKPVAEYALLAGRFEQYLLKIVDRTDKKVTFAKAPDAPTSKI